MKTNKILTLIAFISFVSITITSCINDEDYEIPAVVINETEPSFLTETDADGNLVYNEITFSAVKSAFEQAQNSGEDIVTFEQDLYITGYVISNDASGNFYEELIIQNDTDTVNPETDPRLGIQIEINQSSLYQTYEFGRKVYVKLNGLSAGLSSTDNGVFILGKESGSSIGQIEAFEYEDFIFRSTEVTSIEPKVISLASIDQNDISTFVQVTSAQFSKTDLGLTFSGESTDDFDGSRTLESCSDDGSITFESSTFADFSILNLPSAAGTINGILTMDYFGETNVFKINTYSDISFDGERCDPIVLECTGNTSTDVVVFEEDFQNYSDESQLDGTWTNINISGGSERYEINSFSGDVYYKISAFGTGEDPLEAWLVSPAINLDSTTEEELTFEISDNFDTGEILTVFITEDYTGDPTTTEWIELDANIPTGSSGFGDFVQSAINISCLSGDVHIAFKYLGAADGAETRYHIDDIKVTGK